MALVPEKRNTVIGIDAQSSSIVFFTMTGDNRITAQLKKVPFKGTLYDESFYDTLATEIAEYLKQNPVRQPTSFAVVVTDNAVITDTFAVPSIGRKGMEQAFKMAVENMYVNASDLEINKVLAYSNRQSTTYSVTMMQKNVIAGITRAFNANKISPQFITFPYNGQANAVAKLRPKFKRSSYLFADVKEGYTRLCFVVKGRAVGGTVLPFGYEILSNKRIVAEDMLFDHSLGEITVLNAHEKAKDKAMTVFHEDAQGDEDELQTAETEQEENVFADFEEEEGVQQEGANTVLLQQQAGKAYRKTARKLPKFMIKPTPTDEQGFTYENFCIIAKWILLYLRGNESITSQGEPEFVLVNVPHRFEYLFEMINRHKEENGIEFVSFDPAIEDSADVTSNLEFFGGFYSKKVNPTNLF